MELPSRSAAEASRGGAPQTACGRYIGADRRRGRAEPPISRSERGFEDVDSGRAIARGEDRHDVEAQLPGPPVVRGQPLVRQSSDPELLTACHGLGTDAEGVRGAGLDLAEHHDALALEHQIQLARARPPVAIEHRVAALDVPGAGQRLAVGAERPALHSSLPASSSMLTSLNVTTRTLATNRAGRYMSQTQASCSSSSKYTAPSSDFTSIFTEFVR